MLALKKKREAEAKAKEEAEKAAAASGSDSASASSGPASGPQKVSLLGAVGGRKKKDSGKDGGSGGKKRTPGEIRIQKGTCYFSFCVCGLLLSLNMRLAGRALGLAMMGGLRAVAYETSWQPSRRN